MNKKDLITVTSKAANHNDIISRAPTDMRVVLQSAVNCAAVVTTIQSMLHFNTHHWLSLSHDHDTVTMKTFLSSLSVVWTLSHVTEPITGISHSPRYGPVASPVRPGLTGVKLLQQLYQLSLHCSSSAPVGPASLWTRSNISTIGSPSHIHPLQSPTLLLLSGLSVLVAG